MTILAYNINIEIGCFLGEPYWNKVITTKAIELLVNFGSEQLQLNRIHTSVFEYNIATQRVLEECGFQKEGIRRKAVFKLGQFWDDFR